MDTSEAYTKMCEKAEEIQRSEKRPLDDAGLVIASDGDILCYATGDFAFKVGELIWLPRQDQLQAMVDIEFPYITAKFFGLWCGDIQYDEPKFTSMEQLWLAFVMEEKYNKVWLDGGWVSGG